MFSKSAASSLKANIVHLGGTTNVAQTTLVGGVLLDLKRLFLSYVAFRSGKLLLTVSAKAISVSHKCIAIVETLKVKR